MPLTSPTLESLLARADNKYALINAVAKRARQLNVHEAQNQPLLSGVLGPAERHKRAFGDERRRPDEKSGASSLW